MEPGLWAKFAAALTNFARRVGNPYLRPTGAPGPLPTDGTGRHRPYILPMPMPAPPEPVTPPSPAPVVVFGPQPPDRAAVIAATTWRLLQAHNRARAEKGLPPYRPDGRLGWSADDQVQDNAARDVLDHFGAGGSTPWTRMWARGIPTNAPASENIAEGQPDEATAVGDWLAEPDDQPNHRANVLSAEYTHLGGSMARSASGNVYWCCDYCKLG